MVPPELVTETVKHLAPALPTLILVGTEAAKEVGKKIGAGAVEGGQKIWAWLRPHAEKQPALLEAAREVAAHPEDADTQAVLRIQVRKLLESQPQLVPDLAALVQRVAVQQNTVNVSGDAAVGIGGSASGVTITTNVKK